MERCDFLVIGAGIAGASAAYELAAHGRVVVLEREAQPGYHATGRSAALHSETYGPPAVRALTVASGPFYRAAHETGFAAHPVLAPRGVLLVGRTEQEASLARAFAEGARLVPSVERLGPDATMERAPFLRPDSLAGAVWEPDATDMDVHAIHAGYLRGLRARGGRVATDAEARSIERRNGEWTVRTQAGDFRAPVLVDAAGAWADEVARLAGVRPIGLVPKRRTAIVFEPEFERPDLGAVRPDWPMVVDVDETFYCKPESGRMLGSPADETPSPPCDAQPEELDVAVAVDRIERAAALRVRRIANRWAGLRSFVADRAPVIGPDPEAEGFFWLAGQGGYGIQTAAAAARAAAGLATGEGLPADLLALGLTPEALAPDRATVTC